MAAIILPEDVASLEQARELHKAYGRSGSGLVDKLLAMERQAFFLFLMEALHHPKHNFHKASICEENGEAYLLLEDHPDSPMAQDNAEAVHEPSDPVGGRVIGFMNRMVRGPLYSDDDDYEFADTMSRGVSRDDCWKVARKFFGKKTTEEMRNSFCQEVAIKLDASTPKSASRGRKARL